MSGSSANSTNISELQTADQALCTALESHSAFASQRAAKSGNVYFLWDFARRTDAMFSSILDDAPAPDTPGTRGSVPTARPSTMNESQRQQLKSDAMLDMLISDTTGKTAMMFGGGQGQTADLGREIKDASKSVTAKIRA
ncbi:hypothetical protein EJ04DRAFT_572354 [Polyplosphaeria fusca]|uniref:Uncharacterized protein n=1 Tax=Polyplosphaeria fusca TaxID=682080 RepID=A0A9P4R7M8_9PLEO|nr:hypothetical protein EJ04DRAFT_572354 [Polyplosphaeria fusca]